MKAVITAKYYFGDPLGKAKGKFTIYKSRFKNEQFEEPNDNSFYLTEAEYDYSKLEMVDQGRFTLDENGVADMAFNWMANQGLMDAENNLGIDGTLYESVSPDDYEPLLQQCADDGNELCFAVGFMMDYAVEVAATWNPGTAFAILSTSE